MWCPTCQTFFPFISEKATCIQCATPLELAADDILGESPKRIVKEIRPTQVELTRRVEEAVKLGKHLVSEAGTGTGKSFALIIPAILSGQRVVVSTATTLLQHQYIAKDLPFLGATLGNLDIPVRYAVVKGRSHYFCRKRWTAVQKKFPKKKYPHFWAWVKETDLGDKLELGESLPDFWYLVNAEDCVGARNCNQAKNCGLMLARALMRDADVIIANHAIVGFNIRFGMKILPPHSVYIIDEAHQAGGYFRNALASSLSARTVPNLLRYLEESDALDVEDEDLNQVMDDLRLTNDQLFQRLSTIDGGEQTVLKPSDIEDDVKTLASGIQDMLEPLVKMYNSTVRRQQLVEIDEETEAMCERAASHFGEMEEEAEVDPGILMVAIRKTERVYENLSALAAPQERHVLYLESPRTAKGGHKIVNAPVFVNEILERALFPFMNTVIASSATLTVGENFDFFKREFGFPEDTKEFVAASPFDYARRALLYLPTHIPVHPDRAKNLNKNYEDALEDYFDDMADEITLLAKYAKGHTFVLFTARREMETIFERVQDQLDFPMRMQEPGVSTGDLEKWYRKTDNPVLFGVKSFWEGISIEGDQLRMVIITKVPFPQRSDPIHNAKKEIFMTEQNVNSFRAFMKLDVPHMIMDVKQGVGRLIRTMGDYGVAAILDNKIGTGVNQRRSYANILVNSLPFTTIVKKRELVKQFLDHFAK